MRALATRAESCCGLLPPEPMRCPPRSWGPIAGRGVLLEIWGFPWTRRTGGDRGSSAVRFPLWARAPRRCCWATLSATSLPLHVIRRRGPARGGLLEHALDPLRERLLGLRGPDHAEGRHELGRQHRLRRPCIPPQHRGAGGPGASVVDRSPPLCRLCSVLARGSVAGAALGGLPLGWDVLR